MTIRTTTLVSSGQFPRQHGKLCQIILHFAQHKMTDVSVVTDRTVRQAPVKSPPPTYQHSVFIGQMPFLLTNDNVKALKMTITR